mgnify:FL=1
MLFRSKKSSTPPPKKPTTKPTVNKPPAVIAKPAVTLPKFFTSPLKRSMGGIVPSYFASGGYSSGTDTVPAMLTPGEFVVNKNATQKFLPMLSAINAGTYSVPSGVSYDGGGASITSSVNNNSNTVYNYDIGINVGGSNSSPDDIAKAVVNQIRYIDSQRIRKQRAY